MRPETLTRVKLIAMGILVFVALFLAFALGHSWNWLVCLALVLSWFGDAFLAHWPPLKRRIGGLDPFIAGMSAFALAHVAYITGFVKSLGQMPLLNTPLPGFMLGEQVLPLMLPVYVLAGILFWVWIVMRAEKPRDLKAATLAYCVLLCAMGACACAAAFTGVRLAWPLIIGGILFIVSDGIIAAHLFQGRIPNERRYDLTVWATYLPAQLLLLIGSSWLY